MIQPVFNPAALGLTSNRLVGFNGTAFTSSLIAYAASGDLLKVTSGVASDIPYVVVAHGSQTANLAEWRNSGGVAGAVVTSSRLFSCALQTNSEQFGAGSSVSGATSCAFGGGANTTGTNAFAAGYQATAGQQCTAVGQGVSVGSSTTNIRATGIGNSISITGTQGGIVIGYNSTTSSGGIAVGNSTNTGNGYAYINPNTALTFSVAPSMVFQGSTTSSVQRFSWGVIGAWASATEGSQRARADIQAWDTAGRTCIRIESNGSAGMLGFLGASAVVRQTGGANLTNSVTSGGTDDTISNWTIVDYATDAASIRNAIYQLARTLKQDHDALRLYGLLT
jgi:hypothetical protein